ncbi:Methyltransferase domain-containing protein [Desulfatibacillum alkenivorans DSM 16219]|jgi:ubiquinone/menaquinone biosynthesis C-methylase UbiE|uniref:Methyltransferase domain-containing protein n=1 Tax=Desulfatibacillum alkenivorans DSM 16219 TaxID=1121393 RepID=A0A1M6EEB3_9BACT|nr:class I SAM-dependent methyltransferase [Desulfatibacillum alkenivorans]SHI83816.1 Methyltransferase domain-containing protein [Desulfatibacillum alkenivorans DSM 16219]
MSLKEKGFGQRMDRMPGWAFRGMSFLFSIRDRFFPVDSRLEELPIREGMTVADYGCGPGSYIPRASRKVGPKGTVFAIDVHELAIEAVQKRVQKGGLANVKPVLAAKDRAPLEDESVDLVWAFDMFHMVSQPTAFLREINRFAKSSALLFIDDGHQPRERTKAKILESGAWSIAEEKPEYLKCTPIK